MCQICKTFPDLMTLFSTDACWWTCCGMREVTWPCCVKRRVLSCHDAPPLNPFADSSLRYFSASPPPLPPSLYLNPRRRIDWRVKTKLLSQILISKMPLEPTQQVDERLDLGNLTCRPGVNILVSFAHHWDYCWFFREIGEGAVGHECCYNAQRCKEWGLTIKGKTLYFFKFLRWLAGFCALCGLCKTWLKFRQHSESVLCLTDSATWKWLQVQPRYLILYLNRRGPYLVSLGNGEKYCGEKSSTEIWTMLCKTYFCCRLFESEHSHERE